MSHRSRILLCGVFCLNAIGQTMIDLRTQSKNVDFSSATSTRPFKSGTVLPATCAVGEMFYKTDAPSGANLYGCIAANAWASQGQGSSLPPVTGKGGDVLSTDGSTTIWNALGGDLSGSVNSASVIQLQGRAVSSAAPQQGQALAWNATTNRWEPQTVASSGGSGGGISMLSQSADLAVSRTSATSLSIGTNCSPTTPCNVRFGSAAYSLISGGTANITAGTGTAYVYVSSSGLLTVGHNLTVNCTGNCNAQTGVTSFPLDSVPLFTWSATSGTWDSNGGSDLRAFQSTKAIQPGAGLISSETAGKTTLSADPTLLGMRTAAPPTSSTMCTTGAWAMDNSYFYLCISSNSWRRVATASW
jgi:hypothetical protein